jgi:hypothetical protein
MMKKVLVAVMIFGLMVSASFAAKAITASSSGMRMGIGSYVVGSGIYTGGAGYALLKFIGDTFSGGVGLNFQSASANNASNSTFGVAGQYALNITGGNVPTHVGGALTFNSIPNGSVFTVSLLYGAETILLQHLLVGFDVIPLTFASATANNATTTVFALGSAAVYGSYLF